MTAIPRSITFLSVPSNLAIFSIAFIALDAITLALITIAKVST